jgi:hypothetical protein
MRKEPKICSVDKFRQKCSTHLEILNGDSLPKVLHLYKHKMKSEQAWDLFMDGRRRRDGSKVAAELN